MKKIIPFLSLLLLLNSCSNESVESVTIGAQTWTLKNLDVTHFVNGDPILEAQTKEEWLAAGESQTAAWCYYDGDEKNGDKTGKLYNWYAVNDPRGITDEGWKVPSKQDWEQLVDFLGGGDVAGAKLKNSEGWENESNGTNSSGFSSLPSGYRNIKGDFSFIGEVGGWLTTTTAENDYVWGMATLHETDHIQFIAGSKTDGAGIRLIKK